jgi:hypothetical protein
MHVLRSTVAVACIQGMHGPRLVDSTALRLVGAWAEELGVVLGVLVPWLAHTPRHHHLIVLVLHQVAAVGGGW